MLQPISLFPLACLAGDPSLREAEGSAGGLCDEFLSICAPWKSAKAYVRMWARTEPTCGRIAVPMLRNGQVIELRNTRFAAIRQKSCFWAPVGPRDENWEN